MDLTFYVIQPFISKIKTGHIWHHCMLIIIALFCLTFISKACIYAMDSHLDELVNYFYYDHRQKRSSGCAQAFFHADKGVIQNT